MSCIGNSGDIHPALHAIAADAELTSVLSGNRNFDGRISPDVAQNFLCEPSLVVAYSIAGTMDIDLATTPLATDAQGKEVFLSDLMPSNAEINEVLDKVLTPELFAEARAEGVDGSEAWQQIASSESPTFPWDEQSTYVRRAPYFDLARSRERVGVEAGRALALLGDFVTTDHISPAGSIASDSPAARYLRERGVDQADFNTYGARRGNHEVMMRGTFANVRLENLLAGGRQGGWTLDQTDDQVKSIFDASESYRAEKTPLLVVAGKMYGSGSSRDWAGKGPALLGVEAVIAESFERIHRSNLVQMGVLPLQLPEGESAATLGLDGTETFSVEPVDVSADALPARTTKVTATRADGTTVTFDAQVRIDTPMEARFMASGGILPYVLDHLA